MSSLTSLMFEPRGSFRLDARFGGMMADMACEQEQTFELEPEPEEPQEDPLEQAFAQGYAQGAQDAAALAQQEAREADADRAKIECAFEQLAVSQSQELERRLRETVLLLCEKTLEPLAADPEALTHRVQTALGMLRRSSDERVVRLHPDDLTLIADRLPDAIKVETDVSMTRGQLLVETAESGLEDGPDHWRRKLSEALGL